MNQKEATGRKMAFGKAVCVMLVIALLTGTAVATEVRAAAYVASVGDTQYTSVAAAVADANGSVVKLLADSQETVTVSGDLYLNLNGHELAGLTITDGTLYGMDSTTDDYDCSDGYGKILSITGDYAVHHKGDASGTIKRYLSINQGGTVSFHRVYLGITHTSLRPANAGVGYKAVFAGDEMVQAQLHGTEAFGYTLRLESFNPVSRWKSAGEFVSEKQVTLRLKNYDEVNYGEASLYAAVQLKLSDGTLITSEEYSDTLRKMIETVNGQTADYTRKQLDALADWIRSSDTMLGWEVENILTPGPSIQVSNVTAQAGQSVEVPVLIVNNPGIAGATIEISFDSGLTLTNAVNGEALSAMSFSTSGTNESPYRCSWDSINGEIAADGSLVILTFDIPASADTGDTLIINVSCRRGDIFNNNWDDVDVDTVSGSILIG